MAQCFGYSTVHLVFSTKDREPLIRSELEPALYAYIVGICDRLNSPVHVINGVSDHLHILLEQGRQVALSDLVNKIKSNSSRWIKTQPGGHPGFSWQRGYGFFAVSRQQFPVVKAYVDSQKTRHLKIGFQDEIRLIHRQIGLELDERYAWQ